MDLFLKYICAILLKIKDHVKSFEDVPDQEMVDNCKLSS